MAENAFPILLGTYHVTGTILEANQRNTKQVTEPDKSGHFVRGVNIDNAADMLRAVGDYTCRTTIEPGEADNAVPGVVFQQLKKVAVIGHQRDYLKHVK